MNSIILIPIDKTNDAKLLYKLTLSVVGSGPICMPGKSSPNR